MSKLFLVIDGSALMCHGYYATLPYEVKTARTEEEKERFYHLIEHNRNGVYTNGINAFLIFIYGLIRITKPDYIAVCFDKSRQETFRREMYPDYKAQRSHKPEPLQKQMANIKIFLKAVGIPVLEDAYYEADDFAGSLCKTFEGGEDEVQVRFLTKDKDYFQLISDYTKGWMLVSNDTRTELISKYGEKEGIPYGIYEYDANIVKSEYGVLPSQIADWKGITGDASDNLPGIRGVADKTTIPLLQHYGSLESILCAVNNAREKGFVSDLKDFWKLTLGISRPPIENIVNGAEMGLLCKDLATIKTDLDVGTIEDYAINVNYDKFLSLCKTLELTDLRENVEEWLQDISMDEEYDL